MPPLARAVLVASLVTNPWLFALGAPFWVTALTAPGTPPARGAPVADATVAGPAPPAAEPSAPQAAA